MSPVVMALFFGVGLGAFVFTKMFKNTNNRQTAAIIGGVVGVIGFFIFWSLFANFFK